VDPDEVALVDLHRYVVKHDQLIPTGGKVLGDVLK
jgi:hypothetical protein